MTGDAIGPFTVSRVSLTGLLEVMEQDSEEALVRHFLSEREAQHYGAFRFKKRKTEWLGGRLAAKGAALQHLEVMAGPNHPGPDWQDMEIETARQGRPYLVGINGCKTALPEISISHSKGLAIGLAAMSRCGVDIQKIGESVVRVRDRFAGQAEYEMLAGMSSDFGMKKNLTLLWSAKEAIKKTAMNGPLPGFLDIELVEVQSRGRGCAFEFAVSENGTKKRRRQTVWVMEMDEYAFAMTQRKGRRAQ